MPQNQKTDAFNIGELEELSEADNKFVLGLLQGLSATDALRQSRDCSNMKPETVYSYASRLRHDSKIGAWLLAARTANLGTARVTLDSHLQELERLREMAASTGNYGAAVNAEVSRGKAAGHYVEKFEDVTRDPLAALQELAKIAPDAAKALAQEHGIQLESVH